MLFAHRLGVARMLTPVGYAIATLPVLIVGVVAGSAVAARAGCAWAYLPGNVAAWACGFGELLAAPVLGVGIFPLLSLALLRLERLRAPRALDHARHCAPLYAVSTTLGCVLFFSREAHGQGLGWALGMVLLLVSASAILTNAAVFVVVRNRRSPRAAQRGPSL